jgi:hypothetical protein
VTYLPWICVEIGEDIFTIPSCHTIFPLFGSQADVEQLDRKVPFALLPSKEFRKRGA